MTARPFPLSFAAAGLAAALLAAGCGDSGRRDPASESPAAERPAVVTLTRNAAADIGLTLATAVERPLAGSFTAPARLLADQDLEAHVGSFLPGRVHSVSARLGDRVRRGQILMRIEGLEIGAVKAAFITARAQLQYASAALERQKALAGQNVVSKKSLLEAQAEYDKALAAFNAEDKKIHAIGLTDSDVDDLMRATPDAGGAHESGMLAIRAPIDGLVVERNVVIGQLVDPGTNAFRIVNTSTLWADADVHEKDIAGLSGDAPVSLTFAAFPGERFAGRVTYVGAVVDPRTRMVTVRASVPNPGRRLKPEMFGGMLIPRAARSGGVVIPSAALFSDAGTASVFVATGDTTFALRAVTPGPATADSVLIASGLRAGERVVVNGAFLLRSETRKDAMGGE